MATRTTTGTKIVVEASADLVNTLDDGQDAKHNITFTAIDKQLTNGVSLDQCNRGWEEKIDLTSGSTVDVDLYQLAARDIGAGVGKDALGQTILHEEIVALLVVKNSGDGELEINPTLPSNPIAWIPQYSAVVSRTSALGPNGFRLWCETAESGLDLSSSSKNIRFGANGGAVTFTIYVLARHDDNESSSSSSSSKSSSSSSGSSGSSSSSSSSTSS